MNLFGFFEKCSVLFFLDIFDSGLFWVFFFHINMFCSVFHFFVHTVLLRKSFFHFVSFKKKNVVRVLVFSKKLSFSQPSTTQHNTQQPTPYPTQHPTPPTEPPTTDPITQPTQHNTRPNTQHPHNHSGRGGVVGWWERGGGTKSVRSCGSRGSDGQCGDSY